MTVDPRAVRGFGSAEAYERGRPTYPPAAIQNLSRELGLGPESTVLDLAAGTGKLTRALVRHAGRVIAVEPSPSMIGVLRERLPEIDAREGTAEAIPVETGPSMRCASVRASTGSGRPKRQGRSRGARARRRAGAAVEPRRLDGSAVALGVRRAWSWIANLPTGERDGFRTRVRELLGDPEPLRLPYRTEVHRTRRR